MKQGEATRSPALRGKINLFTYFIWSANLEQFKRSTNGLKRQIVKKLVGNLGLAVL
jgi:hypothetical protein